MQDYEELLSELEEVVSTGKKSVFGNTVSVNPDSVYAVIDKLRESMPMMLREANYIKNDFENRRQEELKRAQDILETAKSRANKMVEESLIVEEAYREADIIKKEAAEYRERIQVEVNKNLQALLYETREALKKSLDIVEGDLNELRHQQYTDEFSGK